MESFLPSVTSGVDFLALDRVWQSLELVNGLRLLHFPHAQDPRFYLNAFVKVGSCCEEAGQSGISHFLEHMMFRGSQKHPGFLALAHAFEWLGGEWNAATAHEYTEYTFETSRRVQKQAIDLFADFIQYPQLLNINTEREIILREIEEETNEFGHCIDTDFHCGALFWPRTSLALPIIGTKQTLEHITKKDLQNYYDAFYNPSRMIIVAMGGDASVLPALAEAFQKKAFQKEALSKTSHDASVIKTMDLPTAKTNPGPHVRHVPHSDSQHVLHVSFLCQGGEWGGHSLAYRLLSQCLSDGLSAPLPMRLREERQLVYDIQAAVGLFGECGTFDIKTSVTKEHTIKALDEILAVLKDLVQKGLDEVLFQKAVFRAQVELDLLSGAWASLAFRQGWSVLHGQDPGLFSTFQGLQALSTDMMHEIIKHLFRPECCALVLLGPTPELTEAALKARVCEALCVA